MRGTKTVSLSLSAALLVGMVGISGCTDNNNNNGKTRTQNVRNQGEHRLNVNNAQQNRGMTRTNQGQGQGQGLNGLRYSPMLSDKVSNLDGLRSAHVMVTGNEAFVGVTLNRQNMAGAGTGTGTPGIGGTTGTGTTGIGTGTTGTGTNRMGTMGTDTTGSTADYRTGTTLYNDRTGGQGINPGGSDYRAKGTAGGLGFTGPTGTTGMNGAGMNGGYTGGGEMSPNGLGGGLGVNTDNGTTGRGRGGMNNNTTTTVPEQMQDKIEAVVKKANPRIQAVYISADPEFVSQMNGYSTNGQNGNRANVNNFNGNDDDNDFGVTDMARNAADDFGDMIQRLFPTRQAPTTGPNGYAPENPLGPGMRNTTR